MFLLILMNCKKYYIRLVWVSERFCAMKLRHENSDLDSYTRFIPVDEARQMSVTLKIKIERS